MKNRIVSFLAGAGAALALSACLTTALAAAGKVSYNFVNVSMDGTQKITAGQDITAANGQKVPGSILFTDAAGGKTNYLPIRTVSELLGVEIGYDSAARTVLLGKQPAAPASSAFTADEMAGALRGDTALIQSRGGTLLPDDDPNSYTGINEKVYKGFLDRNGRKRVEYFVGNLEANPHIVKYPNLLKDLTQDGDFPKNSRGESYGSALLADYVGYAPDLQHMAAYPHEGRPEGYIRDSELQKGGEALRGLSREACPHEYSIPLYDREGNVIGEYKGACQGHLDTTGMTVEEAKAALELKRN
nr:hypothetical protein [uncultured Oscillibacter sp.]